MVDTEFLNKPELELSPPVEQGLNGVVADIESLGLSGFQEMGADADIRMEDGRLIIRRPNTILYEEARQVPFFRSQARWRSRPARHRGAARYPRGWRAPAGQPAGAM